MSKAAIKMPDLSLKKSRKLPLVSWSTISAESDWFSQA